MPEPPRPPGKLEASAVAIAGLAFAASALFLRRALGVAPSLFDAAAAALVAVGFSFWAHRIGGPFLATATRGAGLVAGTLLLSRSLVPPFYSAVVPAAIAIAGGTILQANARRERASAGLDSLGATALLVALALGLVVASSFPEPDRLRLTLLVVAGASISGLVARRFLLGTRLAALAPMPLGVLLVAAIAGSYLSYRGLVKEHVANLPLYEWSAAAMAGALLLARLRRRAKEREVADAWSASARRHAQDVRPVYDERMGPLAVAMGRWLEQGVGFDDYKAAMQAHGAAVPASVAQLTGGRTRAQRRDQAAQRLVAHDSVVRALPVNVPRGPPHGIRA